MQEEELEFDDFDDQEEDLCPSELDETYIDVSEIENDDIQLLLGYALNEPEKTYLICNVDLGFTFADPLILFSHPFYDIHNANEKGFYATGGKLDVETLVKAYRWGIFPWYPYKEYSDIAWYCPRDRFVIFPETIHVGHSLRNLLNKNKYRITINQRFQEVIHNCRTVNERDDNDFAWLGGESERAYIKLYEEGYCKSIEVWEGDELAGGFYGVWMNGVFNGESMFSFKPSASQIGLVMLCRKGEIDGEKIKMIDTQFETPTFKHLGGKYISYQEYRKIMDSSPAE